MAKSKETFGKKEKEKKRLKKRKEKERRREERKAAAAESGGGFDSMIAYVDENGNFTDSPPDPTKKKKIKAEHIEIGVPKRVDEEPEIRRGRVEFFNDAKGFGFIKEIDTREKYFVHINGLMDDLRGEIREGDMVTFDLERGMKGMNAVNVTRAK